MGFLKTECEITKKLTNNQNITTIFSLNNDPASRKKRGLWYIKMWILRFEVSNRVQVDKVLCHKAPDCKALVGIVRVGYRVPRRVPDLMHKLRMPTCRPKLSQLLKVIFS